MTTPPLPIASRHREQNGKEEDEEEEDDEEEDDEEDAEKPPDCAESTVKWMTFSGLS
jgi:hypothetical protein